MKKTILVTAFAMALGIALVPAAAPAQAATKYLDTGTTTYEKYDGAWVKSSAVTSTYNKKGMQTSYAHKYYDSTTGKAMGGFTVKHTYDKKGRVKTMKDYSDGKLSSRSVYTYKKKKP